MAIPIYQCPFCGIVVVPSLGAEMGWFTCTYCGIAMPELALSYQKEKKRGGTMRKLRESLAEYAHDTWFGWISHLFHQSVENPDGTMTIPQWVVIRRKRQRPE